MKTVLILYLILLFAMPVCAETDIKGMVRHVYDGDTALVISRNAGKVKVRLYGIDAPETDKPGKPGQPVGSQAKRMLMYKILGRTVNVEVRDKDQYGRVVGVVRQGGRDVNAEMVREGMAWAYRQYLHGAYASEYIALEENARRHRIGIWRQGNPQPPWVFRQTTHKGRRHSR